jgi:uncharacterized protein DUF1186
MEVQEILPQFATNTGTFPREAVAQAIAQRETMTPELLRVLVEAQHNIEHLRGARSQDSNPWQTQVMALGVPLLDHISLEPV